jgi:hypothetical protein
LAAQSIHAPRTPGCDLGLDRGPESIAIRRNGPPIRKFRARSERSGAGRDLSRGDKVTLILR